jgi:uncharacterized membrane protein
MKNSSDFRAEARQALSGVWGEAAVFTLVYCAVSFTASAACGTVVPIIGGFIAALLLTPMTFAFTVSFLKQLRGEKFDVMYIFKEFNNRVLITMVLTMLYTWLWSLLLIIPGIIKSYSYAMTPFILEDDDEEIISGNEAIEKSMRMMDGHKWELFCLDFSFIGWILLAILTLGIGCLWLYPYINTARAAFYEELKAQQPE